MPKGCLCSGPARLCCCGQGLPRDLDHDQHPLMCRGTRRIADMTLSTAVVLVSPSFNVVCQLGSNRINSVFTQPQSLVSITLQSVKQFQKLHRYPTATSGSALRTAALCPC